MMERFVTLSLLSIAVCGVVAAETPPPDSKMFLEQVRRQRPMASYAVLSGTVRHRRSGSAIESVPVRLGTVTRPERILAQLVVNGNEGYMIGQTFDNPVSTVIPMRKAGYSDPKLGALGLRASDLTMTFLYWPFIRELEQESARGINCRVLELQSPDGKETARVHIAEKYRFPLKAVFTRQGEKTPYRELSAGSFKKQGDFYVVDELALHGPGWRTQIKFDKIEADYLKPGGTSKVFLQLPE